MLRRLGIAELHLMLNRLVLVFWPRVDLVQSYNLPHPPTQEAMTIGTSNSQRTVTLYG